MKKHNLSTLALNTSMVVALATSSAAFAQNLAIVNGVAVPKDRLEVVAQQYARSGRPVTPEMQGQLRDEVIAREVFAQEAQKQGLDATEDYKNQLELMKQSILIRELFNDYQKKNPITDEEAKARIRQIHRQQQRQGIQGPPHPGGKGNRSQRHHCQNQKGCQV